MARVHLFNPENDLALAQGSSNYTAPPNAVALHNAGEMLPMWYATDGDYIIAPNADIQWLRHVSQLFNINIEIFNNSHQSNLTEACPWGWSHDARRQLIKAGVSDSILHNDDTLNKLRRLSHRHTSLLVMQQLKQRLPFSIPPLPIEALSPDEVVSYRNTHKGCFIKSPWSSSGRGVFDASMLSSDELMRRANGIIRRQGSVMCEVALNKVQDFAMLFYSNGQNVSFMGYSSFFTEHIGAYSGNIVAPDSEIKRQLSTMIDPKHLDITSSVLSEILTEIITPHYTGFLGVDMLIYRDSNNQPCLAPCLEVNLRTTMGIVAWHLSNRFLAPGSLGKMKVEFKNSQTNLPTPVIYDHRLAEGTINLVPPNNNFSITFEATPQP